jgi:putative Holliday junction resolvase
MGLPLNLDDSDSVQTEKVREFRRMLENKLKSSGPLSKVTIEWQDERYSTAEAEEVLIEANMSREDRKKIIDRQAAIVILQRYLDRMPAEEKI